MNSNTLSWEAAVKRLRADEAQAQLVHDAYLGADNREAAKRFAASEEFVEVMKLLEDRTRRPEPWRVLDVGAGNGIAAFAFARAGHSVVAVEPDPSPDVGAGAIRRLATTAKLDIKVVASRAEQVPASDADFDVVYVRQALHHADDLGKFLAEAFRLLRPGGVLLATREHVVDDDIQLAAFLDNHPLHKWHGAEYAYRLADYTQAILGAGFKLELVLGPLETVINHFPLSKRQMQEQVRVDAEKKMGTFLGGLFASRSWFRRIVIKRMSHRYRVPGRMYSFLARKVS